MCCVLVSLSSESHLGDSSIHFLWNQRKGGETNKNDNDTKHKDAMQMAAHLYTSQTILFISGQKDLQNILNEKKINHS